MPKVIKCKDCIHSRKTLKKVKLTYGIEYVEVLKCKLGYRIGVGDSPLDNCKFTPKK